MLSAIGMGFLLIAEPLELGERFGLTSLTLRLSPRPLQLDRKVVDLAELRRLACQGVPDAAGLRPVVWKVRKSRLCSPSVLYSLRNVTECSPRSSACSITHVVTNSDAREMALRMLGIMLMVLY